MQYEKSHVVNLKSDHLWNKSGTLLVRSKLIIDVRGIYNILPSLEQRFFLVNSSFRRHQKWILYTVKPLVMHQSIETPTPRPGTDWGIWQGPDQIVPKPPAPGENLEIKFPSPWEQIGKGWNQEQQTKQNKMKPFTLNWSGTKYTLITAIVFF